MNNKDFYKNLGQKIKELRTKRNLTQDELAEKAGIHNKYQGKIERAEKRPSVETLFKLAKALEVRVSDFFDFDVL